MKQPEATKNETRRPEETTRGPRSKLHHECMHSSQSLSVIFESHKRKMNKQREAVK